MYMHMNEGGMRKGEGCPHVGSGRQGPALVAAFAGERGGRREGAGGRSPWQEEMITMIRNIMVMIMSRIKKNSESPFGEPEHACRKVCTAGGGGGRGEGEASRAGGKGCGGSTLR